MVQRVTQVYTTNTFYLTDTDTSEINLYLLIPIFQNISASPVWLFNSLH